MNQSALTPPQTDPTPIFEHFRGSFGSQLLTIAIAHLKVFQTLAEGPLTLSQLQSQLSLQRRPTIVLTTALRAMGLLTFENNAFGLSPIAAEHLIPGHPFHVGNYVGLAAEGSDVMAMLERLQTNRPAGAGPDEDGAAFIYRDGLDSAMEREASARHLTLALAGRAKNVAPHLATNFPLDGVSRLLDVGGGTGIYSIAWLQQHTNLTATVWDRPEVLKVAREMARDHGVENRLECLEGDMFADDVPAGYDCMLLSNILHDWDEPECQTLVSRCAEALPQGGRLLIHDVFLNDALDGPLSIALYSANLFALTEGRAYSAAEYRHWLTTAGLNPGAITPTLVHCGVLPGVKR